MTPASATRRRQGNQAKRCSWSWRSKICAAPPICSGRYTTPPTESMAGSRWKCRRCWPTTRHSSIDAAARIHQQADRPNLFVKIPGTPEGVPAIEESIFAGVPINVTLLFSREQYLAAAEAYLRGIERRIAAGLDPRVASVASLFVSRWDKAVSDKVPAELRNRLGIAIAAHLSGLSRAAGVAALADARRGRRPPAAPALGQHRHQGSQGVGHAVRRSACRARHDQHHAGEDPAGIRRARRAQGAMAEDGGDAEAVLARFRGPASMSTPSRYSCSARARRRS